MVVPSTNHDRSSYSLRHWICINRAPQRMLRTRPTIGTKFESLLRRFAGDRLSSSSVCHPLHIPSPKTSINQSDRPNYDGDIPFRYSNCKNSSSSTWERRFVFHQSRCYFRNRHRWSNQGPNGKAEGFSSGA